jgi:hypothetical protein
MRRRQQEIRACHFTPPFAADAVSADAVFADAAFDFATNADAATPPCRYDYLVDAAFLICRCRCLLISFSLMLSAPRWRFCRWRYGAMPPRRMTPAR